MVVTDDGKCITCVIDIRHASFYPFAVLQVDHVVFKSSYIFHRQVPQKELARYEASESSCCILPGKHVKHRKICEE